MGNSKMQNEQETNSKIQIQKLKKKISKKNENITERDNINIRDNREMEFNDNHNISKNFSGGSSSKDEEKYFNDEENLNLEISGNNKNNNNNQNILNKINKSYYHKEYNEDNLINSNYLKGENPNKNLTNKVWPKSRTFLSIVSKMFNDNYINEYQRGLLKEMIMDQNQYLDNILDQYEMDADSEKLYQNIIALADSYDKKII